MAAPPNRRAVTLVELLVVIGIVGLLAGILAPTLSGVRGAARSAQCLGHLRQMSVASQQYATIWNAWPAAIRYERRDGVLVQIAWDWVGTMDFAGGGEMLGPGPLWSFMDDPDHVQQCPEYHGTTNFATDPYTGYNYNTTYIGGEQPFMGALTPDASAPPAERWKHVQRTPRTPPHACRRGSQCAMFGDGGWGASTNKFMRAPVVPEDERLLRPSPYQIYAGAQAYRHEGGTNVAYVDGHVAQSTRRHEGALATASLLTALGDDNGFLSEDAAAYDPR